MEFKDIKHADHRFDLLELEEEGKSGIFYFLEPVIFKYNMSVYILTGVRWRENSEVYLWKENDGEWSLIDKRKF